MVRRPKEGIPANRMRTTSSTPSADTRDRVDVCQQRVLCQDEIMSTERRRKLVIKRREADDAARILPEHVQASIKNMLPVFRRAKVSIYDSHSGADYRYSYLGDRGYETPPSDLEDGAYLDEDLKLASDLIFSPGERAAIPYEAYDQAQENVTKFYEIKVYSNGPLNKMAYILAKFKGHEYPFAISSTIISSKRVQQRTKAGLTPADDRSLQANINAQPESALLNGCKDLAHIAVFDLSLLEDTIDGIRKQVSVVSNADREKSNKASVVITVHERMLVGMHPKVRYRFRGGGGTELRDMDWAVKLGSEGWLHLNINGPRYKKDLLEVEPLPNGPIRATGPGTEITVRVLACDEKKVNQHEFDQIARQDYNADPVFIYRPNQHHQQSVLFVPGATDGSDGGESVGEDSDDDQDDDDDAFYNDQIANSDEDDEDEPTKSARSKKSSKRQLPLRRAVKREQSDDSYRSALFHNTLESLERELEAEQANEGNKTRLSTSLKRSPASRRSTHEEDDDEIQFLGSSTSLARRPHSFPPTGYGNQSPADALPNNQSASILRNSLARQGAKRIKIDDASTSSHRTASPVHRRSSSSRASQERRSSALHRPRSSPMFLPESRGASRSPFAGRGHRLGS